MTRERQEKASQLLKAQRDIHAIHNQSLIAAVKGEVRSRPTSQWYILTANSLMRKPTVNKLPLYTVHTNNPVE